MDCLVETVGGQGVLFILVVQVANIVITDAQGFIILASKKYASLCQINQGYNVAFLLHKFILREFVVRNQICELFLQLNDLFARVRLLVEQICIPSTVTWLQKLSHARIQNTNRFRDLMRRLKYAKSG